VAAASAPPAGDFWAITSYFNPVRYRHRLSNYRTFRRHLNMPLIAVELTYADDFELQDDDADVLVRLRGGAMLWQKERLLDRALRELPEECRKVALLDCDIIFRADQWTESASRLLDEFPLIQLFKHVHYLPAHWNPSCPTDECEFSRPSCAYAMSSGVPAADCLAHNVDSRITTASTGHAWAVRRELLDRHGYYDACIVGGGDRAVISGALGCWERLMERHCMSEPQRQHYLAWAESFYGSVCAETSFIEGDILHLWHGDISLRAGRTRHEGLQRFCFDPFEDIAILENGSWSWNTDKPEMHNYVRGYFSSRREDG